MPRNAGNPEVGLAVLNSMERIGQSQPLRGKPEAAIKAAKNEVESFQVVVGAADRSVRVVDAVVSDLAGEDGTIGRGNITLFREEYVRVRRSSPRAKLPPGLYADPLVPFINPQTGAPIEPAGQYQEKWGDPIVRRGFDMSAVPFDVWRGQNQPIWVDVFIPRNAAAGEYRGTFTVALDDFPSPWGHESDGILTTTLSIPITVTVWDFTLPDSRSHRTHFGGVGRIAELFGVEPNSDRYRDIEMRYCRMMSEHRISPPIPGNLRPETNDDGSLVITPERHHALRRFMEDFRMADFEVPRAPMKDVTTTNRHKGIRYYGDYHKYLKDNEWDSGAYVYMYDEPNLEENYQMVLALGAMIHEAAPELKRLVVEQPYNQDPAWPDIDPAVDIWCPLFSFIDGDSIDEKLAHGDEVWSYTALSQRAPEYHPHYSQVKDHDPPYWHIDGPLTSYRTPTWMNWQYGIRGLLYWATISSVVDPWNLPALSIHGNHFNGEGYLIYPGKPCGIDGPISSIRLKNIRDSMEDYEYLMILEKLAGREAVKKIVSMVAPNWWATTEDPQVILSAREMIANEILRIQG